MIMTTPNEFLQFAKEMGLDRIKSSSQSQSDNNGCTTTPTTTGLSVLNNLCRIIEQISQLKAENARLHAHLDLVTHVEKFQQRCSFKINHENSTQKPEQIISAPSFHKEKKSVTLSPSNSLKLKKLFLNRDQKDLFNNHEDSPIDQSEMIENNLNSSSIPSWHNWSKVRHAFKFNLRKKQDSLNSPPLIHTDRQIPAISISIESDDDHLQHSKYQTNNNKKKKIITTTNDNRPTIIGEDTDQDDESIQFIRSYHSRRLYGNETPNAERQETSSANVPSNNSTIDDETLLTRKQSKIARYRRKLRSKLDTVKKQFSDQNSSSSRVFSTSHGSTFDDIGFGLNHALLTARLAPALTKSYQQKMREWETTQKSDFLVSYRRQSIIPKIDLNISSRKNSLIPETSTDLANQLSTIDNCSLTIEESNINIEPNLTTLGPILSPNQRSLIVHQWREIMWEEISLRHYNEYLQKQVFLLKELEQNFKILKTSIFCTNNQTLATKQHSVIDIKQIKQYKQTNLPQRCHSLQSSITMPASWILAVQSAAYSDVLDGTSNKTTERDILFSKQFFDQLEHFKKDRLKFQQDFIKDLQLLNPLESNEIKPSDQSRIKHVLKRGCLRKLSLVSTSEFPEHFSPDPVIPLQTTISQLDTSINLNKHRSRSRFDFKKTFQQSKTMCISQFNSWFHRRRQQDSSVQRRKSAIESNISTPTLFGSPRLARFHQRIFKQHSPSLSDRIPLETQILDDTDNCSQYDLPVRIYLPPLTTPLPRRVCITDVNILTSNNYDEDIQIEQQSNTTTPIIHRKYVSSSLKMTTAKERRESFATLSNILNNRC